MENIEGLWTVSFQSNFQTLGTGVVVLIRDRVLGGDYGYYYDGTAKIQDNKVEAIIKVVKFNPAAVAIFGNINSYTLKVSGNISASDMELHGNMAEQPSMKITITGKKITGI